MVKNITNSFQSILVILLFFLSLPMAGADEETIMYHADDLYYILYDDGTATVTSCVISSTKVEIPLAVVYENQEYSVTSIDNYAFYRRANLTSIQIPNSVTSIGDRTFYECTSLTSIQIPNSVTSIGNYAFAHCTSLTSIQIPNSVTSIGYGTFANCTSLTSIQIPNSVTSIGDGTFYKCTSLTSIQIPNSVTSIGDDTFYKCTSLTSIQIPNSVTSIGNYAFYNCTNLKTVIIPNSVTSIGNYAFSRCTSLASIDVAEDNQYYTQQEGVLFNKELTELIQFPCGKENKEYEIPNSVTSIGDGTFYDCTSLTSIQIPNSVTSIGYEAFKNCTSLTSIQIPNSVTSIGYEAFYQCTSLTKIICDAIVPPTAEFESTFDTDTYTNCQLLVPEESIDSYKNSQYVWSKFANISANPEYVDIDTPEASYSATSHPTIYNINGTAVSGDTQSLSPGIYIIKEGSKSRKILVK